MVDKRSPIKYTAAPPWGILGNRSMTELYSQLLATVASTSLLILSYISSLF